MKARTVIRNTSLPTRLPIQFGCLLFLMLERFNASPLAWGIFGTLYTLVFVTSLVMLIRQKEKDVTGFGEH